MGGQTGTQQQQTQQTTQLPPWINDAAQQNYGVAQAIAARPLQQYQGQMTPDVSDQLQQSWNTAATAGNAGLPQYNAATAGFVGALGQTPMSVTNPGNASAVTAGQVGNTDLSKYMDPYTQSVINSSLPIMQQQLGQSLAANAGTAAQTGAFGGSRFGVQQGTAQAQGALGMANMAAGLNAANFTQAQAAATGDINRQLTADTTNQASQQTDLARALQAQGMNQTAQQNKINSDIAASSGLNTTGQGVAQQANNAFTMQNTAGTQEMSNAQDQINAQMSKFQQAWGYPTQQLGVLQSALGMTPYGQSTSGQSQHADLHANRLGAACRRGHRRARLDLRRQVRSDGSRRTSSASAKASPACRSTTTTGRASLPALRRPAVRWRRTSRSRCPSRSPIIRSPASSMSIRRSSARSAIRCRSAATARCAR